MKKCQLYLRDCLKSSVNLLSYAQTHSRSLECTPAVSIDMHELIMHDCYLIWNFLQILARQYIYIHTHTYMCFYKPPLRERRHSEWDGKYESVDNRSHCAVIIFEWWWGRSIPAVGTWWRAWLKMWISNGYVELELEGLDDYFDNFEVKQRQI